MAEFYIGNKLVRDEEGIPVLGEDGEEFYVLPEEFEYLGMSGADAFRWSPRAFDKSAEAEQGEQ